MAIERGQRPGDPIDRKDLVNGLLGSRSQLSPSLTTFRSNRLCMVICLVLVFHISLERRNVLQDSYLTDLVPDLDDAV